MRSIALISCISLLLQPVLTHPDTTEQSPANHIHFFAPSLQNQPHPRGLIPAIFKRQNTCQTGYNSCASLSAPDACCPSNTSCARDSAGNIACCPQNYVCTGVLSGIASSSTQQSSNTAGTTNVIVGGTVTVTSTAGVTGSGGAATTTQPQQPVTITAGSTVPNNFYPFPYIATTYQNSAACLSAYSFCQTQSTSCFTSLAGQNAVTVSNAMGSGGVTVQGVTGVVQSSASSICSSLSLQGCYGLQSTRCSAFGNGGSATSGLVPVNAAAATAGYCDGEGRYYAAAAVAAVAVVGAGMVV